MQGFETAGGSQMGPRPEWFGLRLKALREARGLTQRGLADAAGLAVRAVTYYEAGARYPTWDVVLALAAVLGEDCTAFTQPPAEREPAKPGRPPKPKEEQPSGEKRPRGRLRKSD
jgi:transcriptional regulator with XRE-family HTH domain